MSVSTVDTASHHGAEKPPLPHGLRQVEVLSTQRIAPRIQRVRVSGADIRSMPEGPNIKLFIPPEGLADWPMPETDARGRPFWPDPKNRPAIRTYSVRWIDRQACLLDIDFVLHDHDGPASRWAASAKPGARLLIGGPGGRDVRQAGFYVLAGDLSSLAAIAYVLEGLPETARGTVLVEVPGDDDRIVLRHPPGFSVVWLRAPSHGSALPDAVRQHIDWNAQGDAFLWIGGESDAVRQVRAFGREEIGLDKRMILAVGYWKRGFSEDAYHHAHDNDRDADYHAVWQEERMRKVSHEDVTIQGSCRFDLECGDRLFRIFVYQPKARAPAGGFPVIYALDGNAHLLSMIASTKAHGVRPALTGLDPAIVVGVGYATDDDLDLEQRTFDYTPDVDRSLLGDRPDGIPWQNIGGADMFLSIMDDIIKPRIEADFPVDTGRQSLFGHSFGGLCTLYAALTRPGSYQNFIVSSPSIWFGEKRILAFLDGFHERLEAVDSPRSLILSVGELEQNAPEALFKAWPAYANWITRNNMVGNLRDLHHSLAALSLPQLELVFREIEDEHHGSVPPVAIHKAVPVALRTGQSRGRKNEPYP